MTLTQNVATIATYRLSPAPRSEPESTTALVWKGCIAASTISVRAALATTSPAFSVSSPMNSPAIASRQTMITTPSTAEISTA